MLYYCPACTRVYYLPEGEDYLCGRNHAPAPWPDGRVRRFSISERTNTNQPPWAIPSLVEERELLDQDTTVSWLSPCRHPEDFEFSDIRRHFGYGAPGTKHLTKSQVLQKYASFVLQPVEQPPEHRYLVDSQ